MVAEQDDPQAVRLSQDQLAQLADLLRRDGVRTVQLDTAKGRFAVTLGESGSLPGGVAEAGIRRAERICAASVGEFLTGYPTRVGPLVRQGGRVAPGDLLGLVRTGLVFAPVTLPSVDPREATLTRVLVAPGTLVGYGTPLFEVERH